MESASGLDALISQATTPTSDATPDATPVLLPITIPVLLPTPVETHFIELESDIENVGM